MGLVGGIDDKYVDYGVQKLSDSSLKLTRLTYPNQPIVGSGSLSGSVSRVYVNVLDYTKVSVTSSYATRALTSSFSTTSAPRTAIYRYGTTSIVNPGGYADTIIKYDTAVSDSTSWYNNSNGRFTPTVAGWYMVCGSARVYGGSSTAEGYIGLFKNGVRIVSNGGLGFVQGPISFLVYFNGSTDYVQFYSTTGPANTNSADSSTTSFSMVYMTP